MAVPATQPLQPAAESTEHAAPSQEQQPAVSPASSNAPEQATPRTDWFRDAMNDMRGRSMPTEAPKSETPPASAPKSEPAPDAQSEQAPSSAAPSGQKQDSPSPKPALYTEEEVARRAQAETDRRLDKFQREEAERRRRAVAEQEALRERDLRERDPYGYVKLLKEREQEAVELNRRIQETQTHVVALGNDFDRNVLDPLITAVPAPERARILQNVGEGVEGRGQVAQAALKALERHWRQQGMTEARRVLMNDPAFIKEVRTRFGEGGQEPDSIPSVAAASPASSNVNDILRAMRPGRR